MFPLDGEARTETLPSAGIQISVARLEQDRETAAIRAPSARGTAVARVDREDNGEQCGCTRANNAADVRLGSDDWLRRRDCQMKGR